MSITVAPIRLFIICILILLSWPFTYLVTSDQCEKNRYEPRAKWKKYYTHWNKKAYINKIIIIIIIQSHSSSFKTKQKKRPFVYAVKYIFRGMFFVASFHWINVKGELNMNTPIVVIAPHTSFIDSMFFSYFHFLSAVARYGTEETPFFGPIVKVIRPLIVNREKSSSRSNTVQKILERVKVFNESEHKIPPLALFPEGTCSNMKVLARFKSGSFIAGVPVQPICLKYPNLRFDSITWTWDGVCLIHYYLFIFLEGGEVIY